MIYLYDLWLNLNIFCQINKKINNKNILIANC